MIKRPLSNRFNDQVVAGIKVTTIRDKPWSIGAPVMFYNWSGLPYRSKQIDVCAVMVEDAVPIRIGRVEGDVGMMCYHPERWVCPGRQLWNCEGFFSQKDMDEWFRPKFKPGQFADKFLMKFQVMKHQTKTKP